MLVVHRRHRLLLVSIIGILSAWNVFLFNFMNHDDYNDLLPPTSQSSRQGISKPSPIKDGQEVIKDEWIVQQETRDAILKEFPTTRFTRHVMELVDTYDFDKLNNCAAHFHLRPNPQEPSWPHVECTQSNPRGRLVKEWWCVVLKRIFWKQGRVLPHAVTFSVSPNDYLWKVEQKACLGSSNDGGNFTITNFNEVNRMRFNVEYKSVPWERRSSRPIFRGAPWIKEALYAGLDRRNNASTIYKQVLSISPRLKAVDFSLRHPSLLDARVHRGPNDIDTDADNLWSPDSPTGLHKLLSIDAIPKEEYFTQHQVALVLCGIGAAFRTSIHFEMSTAIVMQKCDKQEWYTSMLIPFKHYVPLDYDLSDLEEKMKWVRDNPHKVRTIAENGRKFFDEYLSFSRNEEHIYEFVYRLAMKKKVLDSKGMKEIRTG